jgi:hypothetical protein
MSKSEVYRDEIDRLIREQNEPPLPLCPFDGDPCPTPGRGCECVMDVGRGEEKIWRCDRFHPENASELNLRR